MSSGACALESEVVYLKEGGSGPGGANCTKALPCGALSTAIGQAMTGTRPYIRVSGTIENANGDINGKTVMFLGQADAVLRGGQGGGASDEPILDLSNSAKLEIHDLMLRDGREEAVRVDDAASTLLLQRSKIVNMGFDGVSISNAGKATIVQSEISSCDAANRRGVNLVQGEVTITRSKIFDNSGGVLISDNQTFQITNSFIVENKTLGGIRAAKPGPGSKLEFNTIADNQHAGNGITDAAGVLCDDMGFTFSGNIIFRNTGGAGGLLQTFGTCKFDGSVVSSNTQAETRTLGFAKDTAPRDYHLTAGSPAIVKDAAAGATCAGQVDIDGDPRPQGGACDLGADEVK